MSIRNNCESANQPVINEYLITQLISEQFPQWKNLAIQSVARQGSDNRTFRLGN